MSSLFLRRSSWPNRVAPALSSEASKRRDDDVKKSPVRADVAMAVPAALKPLVEVLSPETGVTVEKGWGSSSVVLKARGKIFVMASSQRRAAPLHPGTDDTRLVGG